MTNAQEIPIPPHRISGAGPALVLLHNGFYSQASWDPVRTTLDQFFTCISFDRAGYGDAAARAHAAGGLESGVAELENLVDALEESGQLVAPFFLAGHCVGGAIAMHYTAAHPDNVKRLVIEGTGFRTDADISRRIDLILSPWDTVPRTQRKLLEMMHGKDYAELLWRMILEHRSSYVLKSDYSSLPLHSRILCPVLLIQGSDDIFFSVEHAEMGASLFPDSRCWLPDATGHDVHRDRPADWVQKVTDFLLE